ncbi:MAG: hypothetical protein FJ253_06260 [Phycisphaerae bacterium]|nr:hypothetical protein [Phycisphaerae bacterium]
MQGASERVRVNLSATLAPLGDPESGLDFLGREGFEAVQLSASQPGMRPRELDGGARRALRERMRRLELAVSGIDLWIPAEHFGAASEVSRAIDAFLETLRLAEFLDRCAVSCTLPRDDAARDSRAALLREAERRGVLLVDFAEGATTENSIRVGLDLASIRPRELSVAESIASAGDGLGAIRLSLGAANGGRRPFRAGDEGMNLLRDLRSALRLGGATLRPVADARGWPDARAGLRSTRDAWNNAAGLG